MFPAFEEKTFAHDWANFLTTLGPLGSPIRTAFRVFPAAGRKVAVQLGADRQHHAVPGGWVYFSLLGRLYDYDARSGLRSTYSIRVYIGSPEIGK